MSEIYIGNAQMREEAVRLVKQSKLGSTISVTRKRTLPQNSRYWSNGVLAQIARKAIVRGQRFSAESWHEYFKQMLIGVIELPNGSVVGKSSTELNVEEFAKFALEVEAYAAEYLGVEFEDKQEAMA